MPALKLISRALPGWKMKSNEGLLGAPFLSDPGSIQKQMERNYSSKKKLYRMVIVGSGWGGFKMLKELNHRACQVIVVSPRNYFLFTPLLASSSVGTVEFRSIIEPVRSASTESNRIYRNFTDAAFPLMNQYPEELNRGLVYHQASVNSIDLKNQAISCTSALSDGSKFSLNYDYLAIACGAVTNTFGIPGVVEHANFLKDIKDARSIRYKILKLFEQAMSINSGPRSVASDAKIRQLLHFVVVGGGPTGIEFSAELHDFIRQDLCCRYPEVMDKIHMSLLDVAPTILSSFDKRLSDYTANKFARAGMSIRTGTVVQKVEENQLIIKDGPPVPFGLLVWATGLSPNSLVTSLKEHVKLDRTGRLMTDARLRLLIKEGGSSGHVFAIGDCATIEGYDLPATAKVAKQKGKYLAKCFNDFATYSKHQEQQRPFSYHDLGSMAYIGGSKAIVAMPISSDGKLKWNQSGIVAWILWKSAYFTMTISGRNKVLIAVYWLLARISGRDMTHIR